MKLNMQTEEWPYTDRCDICGIEWTESELNHRYDNVNRSYVGPSKGVRFNEDTGVKEPIHIEYEGELVTRHAEPTICLINMSKKMGIFQRK